LVEIGLKRISPNKGKALVLEETETGCVICTSHIPNHDGYIRIYQGKDNVKRYKMLHRMAWEKYKGDIPEGYEIDHMCRNRKCCNPEHLQLLGISEHKVKTNKERYAERIEGVIHAIQEGYGVKQISEAFGVTVNYVNRYKRKLH
jgi:hypothetical protein